MSSSERGRLGRHVLLAGWMLAASALAGCAFSPVYAPSPTGRSVSAETAAIAIELPDGRVEQTVRNRLIFAFNGGQAAAPSRYKLRLTVSISDNLVGVTRLAVSPSYSLSVAVAYELSEIGGNTIITRGVARGVASYDRSNQGFANERARLEAEDRGATAAADEIRLKVAAALAQR